MFLSFSWASKPLVTKSETCQPVVKAELPLLMGCEQDACPPKKTTVGMSGQEKALVAWTVTASEEKCKEYFFQ